MGVPVSAYAQVTQHYHTIAVLDEVAGMLGWDMQTLLPSGSGLGRGEHLATLQKLVQQMFLAPEFSTGLNVAAQEKNLDTWQFANIREMQRLYRHAAAVAPELVAALAKARLVCEMRWREARRDNDFAGLLPAWQELLNLTREMAQSKAQAFGTTPYEALVDEYEPGLRVADLDTVFDDLAAFLPPLLQRVVAQKRDFPALPKGPFPIPAQQALCSQLLAQVGFNFAQGRLDISTHPFCGGVVDDIRLTTRYREDDCLQSLMSLLHESGHAAYEAGLPREWRYQPVGKARGMAMHESQSLFIEMQCARSREFLTYLTPLLREYFPAHAASFTLDKVVTWVKWVQPSSIRVEADEVTYPLHIILRYRLERAMIDGDLALRDLPAAFNDGMRELLGITPSDDRQGCLQDVHWPSGAYGYFPTYSLGAMIAAQLMAKANADLGGNARADLARGDFSRLLAWQRQHIHAAASHLSMDELLRQATGEALNVQHYKNHLEKRYLS